MSIYVENVPAFNLKLEKKLLNERDLTCPGMGLDGVLGVLDCSQQYSNESVKPLGRAPSSARPPSNSS